MPQLGARLRPWTRSRFTGLILNATLALAYLTVSPITTEPHRDLAILVGSYFAAFVLADVTTTNALGADAQRVRAQLAGGTPLHRVLARNNLMLFLVAGSRSSC